MTDEQFDKLPKFARDEILQLRMRLEEARDERLRIIPGRSPESRVVVGQCYEVGRLYGQGSGFSFTKHEHVAFRLSDEDHGSVHASPKGFGWIKAHRDESMGVPFLTVRGCDALIVQSRATNEIRILQAPGGHAEIPSRFW